MDASEKQEKISGMILNYLRKNAGAGDTLKGITQWWLELARIESSVDEVADALESLTQKGIIRMHKLEGGTTFYKINEDLTYPF